jgi:glycosyltransferase involved in cell wall biosynthesis
MNKKIAILLWSELKYDGRVQKEIKTFQSLGMDVALIVSKLKDDSEKEYNFQIINLDVKPMRGALFNFFYFLWLGFLAQRWLLEWKPDHIHCNDLPTLIGGVLYKLKYNQIRLVYDSHELFPEMQKNLFRRLLWNGWERLLVSVPDIVIQPEVNRLAYFKDKYKNRPLRLHLVENFPEKPIQPMTGGFFNSLVETPWNKHKSLYLGALLKDRDLEEIILAFHGLTENYCLFLMGHGKADYIKALRSLIEEERLQNRVFLLPPVPNHHIPNVIASSDIGLVFYQNSNLNNYYCASNKLYEFIICKKPVLTNDYPGLQKVVLSGKRGVCLHTIARNEITNAIKDVVEHRDDYLVDEPNFYWDSQVDVWRRIYF